MEEPNALLVFVKNPIRGKVKTRLAREAGEERAFRIYEALLAHTRQLAQAVQARRYLFYSHWVDFADAWPNAAFEKHLQVSADLGGRMRSAFDLALQSHQRAVIIGSDCSQLKHELLVQTFALLENNDCVIGPATDGGYYLLGLNSPCPQLFSGISWSSDKVLPQTLAVLEKLGKTHTLLPVLSDIDHWADWEAYGWPLD